MATAAVTITSQANEIMANEAYDLIKSEYSRMVGFVRSRLSDSGEHEAEDVVQDVLASVAERLNVAAPLEDLTAYLYRGLRNRIVDMFRSNRNMVSLDESAGDDVTIKDLLKDLTHVPERHLTAKEAANQLYSAMDQLSEDEQEVIVAVEIEGYTFAELAEMWDSSINTLLSRKTRGMKKLKATLYKEEPWVQ
jgi:RNA polymerase sigma factor (sigma-70 family)